MNRNSYCTTLPSVGIGAAIGICKIFKFYVEDFYVMGKALIDELSCSWTGFVSAKKKSLHKGENLRHNHMLITVNIFR